MIELRWEPVDLGGIIQKGWVMVEDPTRTDGPFVLQYRERQVDKDLVAFWTDWQDVKIEGDSDEG